MYYASKYKRQIIFSERCKSCSFRKALLVKPLILIYALMCIYILRKAKHHLFFHCLMVRMGGTRHWWSTGRS